jgi:hypothetical protein
MIESGDSARFAFESLPALFALMHSAREDFDGYNPVEPCVLSAINFSHTAGAQWSDDHIRTESVTSG